MGKKGVGVGSDYYEKGLVLKWRSRYLLLNKGVNKRTSVSGLSSVTTLHAKLLWSRKSSKQIVIMAQGYQKPKVLILGDETIILAVPKV